MQDATCHSSLAGNVTQVKVCQDTLTLEKCIYVHLSTFTKISCKNSKALMVNVGMDVLSTHFDKKAIRTLDTVKLILPTSYGLLCHLTVQIIKHLETFW